MVKRVAFDKVLIQLVKMDLLMTTWLCEVTMMTTVWIYNAL